MGKIPGKDFKSVNSRASEYYKKIKRRSKRRPYLRSAYFKKDKIFLEIFWQHLFLKENWRDRVRRLKYFPAAIKLIEYSKHEPQSKENPNKRSEILHRFSGCTLENDLFHVQIKEDKKTSQKWLISIFPDK